MYSGSPKNDTVSTFEHTQNVSIFGEPLYVNLLTSYVPKISHTI